MTTRSPSLDNLDTDAETLASPDCKGHTVCLTSPPNMFHAPIDRSSLFSRYCVHRDFAGRIVDGFLARQVGQIGIQLSRRPGVAIITVYQGNPAVVMEVISQLEAWPTDGGERWPGDNPLWVDIRERT